MFKTIALGAFALTLLAAPAQAERRVYSGTEAQALQCAAFLSYATYVMERRGLITFRNREEGAIAATRILGRHVGGTFAQKQAAFQAVLNRLPERETALMDDSVRHMTWCTRRFLG